MATSDRSSTLSEQQLAAASMLLSDHSASISALWQQVVATSSSHDEQVLGHLLLHPGQRPHDLMVVTGLSRPGVAAVVTRLERLGLVRRSFGQRDRRTMLTSLTPIGRRRLAELERALAAHFVATGPQVAEILHLLDCEAGGPAEDGIGASAIASAGRLSEVLAAYAALLDDDVQSLQERQRVAVSMLMSWGPSRPTQLAEALHLSSGGLTYVMDQLQAAGIITRSYGPAEDRRAVLIDLTARGVEYGRSLCSALAASAPDICAVLRSTTSPARVGSTS